MLNHKKKKQSWISNGLFIVLLFVLLFTPAGTTFKVWINRLLAFSPSVEKVENQEKLHAEGWLLLDEKGNQVAFEDFKEKPIIINFWATWCPPCIAEKPSFQKLYDDYREKVFFLFVTSDAPEKVLQFKTKHGYTLPVYYPVNAIPTMLQSSSVPASYVIDKSGNIVLKKFRAADWNSKSFRKELDGLL